MAHRNGLTQLLLGLCLLLSLHTLAILILGATSIACGFLGSLGSLLNALVGILNALIIYTLLGLGVSQLLYVIPLVLQLHRRRRWGLIQGVILGALLTAVLNGWGLMLALTAL